MLRNLCELPLGDDLDVAGMSALASGMVTKQDSLIRQVC